MTEEEFSSLELPVPASDRLYVESGLEWLRDHTTLKMDIGNIESVKALPSSARLFLVKFCEISRRDTGIASESVGPMSQSFSSSGADQLIGRAARQLLKPYLNPTARFIPCGRRWR